MPTGQALPFLIEMKRPGGGVQTIEQQETIKRASEAGVLAFFADNWQIVRDKFQSQGVMLRAA